EIGVIENIECFGPELQIQSFTDSYPLEQRSVDAEHAGSTERTATHVPERPLGRQHKGSRIEPLIRLPQNHRSFKVRIPARYIGVTRIASPGNIGASQRREGEPALLSQTSIPLPSANQLVQDSSGTASEALAAPKRQKIAEVRVELVKEAVGCDPAV